MKNKTLLYHSGKNMFLLFLFACLAVTVFLASCSQTDENIIGISRKVSDTQPAVIPAEVSLSDSEMEVGICTIHQLIAAGGEKITWTSSDSSVATVDAEGKVTGIGAGECEITAENEFGKKAQCRLRVKKCVFITIDDGPLSYCSKILRALREYDVKATFFVVKTYDIKMVKRIHEEGHCIGLHTYSHNFSKCYRSEYSYYADLEKLKTIIKDYTGETPDIIRFPGGTSNTKIGWKSMRRMVSGLDDLGYRAFDWTLSAGDSSSEPITYQQAASNVLRECGGDVNIVLMHDKETTPNAVRIIVSYLREKGFTFDTLDHYAEHSFRTNSQYEKSHGDAVIPCTRVTLDVDALIVEREKSRQLKAVMEPDETTDYLRFVSDDPAVAAVTLEGVITGIRPGTTHIRAIASSGTEAVCTVTVL